MRSKRYLPTSRAFILATAGLLPMALAGCNAFEVLNTVSPSAHYERLEDIPYGDLPRQRIDVYKPVATEKDVPLVVFFYGGGWRDGAKGHYEFVASSLTKSGIVVMIPDYRLYPDVRFPAFVEDGAAAVAWAYENAGKFGVNPANVFLMGHSAGAHIAALLALNPDYLEQFDLSPEHLAGFIGLAGPYDFLPLTIKYLEDVFPVDSRDSSQPINFVSPKAPRTLLIHGTGDNTVLLANSTSLAEKLRANGVPTIFKQYDGVGHARVVATLAPPLDFLSGTLEDSKSFIRETCRASPCLRTTD